MPPVFRFAPSPNGYLHLGHALSALLNAGQAAKAGGRLLLRIEDIDRARCRSDYEQAIYDDLAWLGVRWERPVRRQSDHLADYRAALDRLAGQGLVYPSFESRAEVAAQAVARDPDGAPLYSGAAKSLSAAERERRIAAGEPYALRLDMEAALARVSSLTSPLAGEVARRSESEGGRVGGEQQTSIRKVTPLPNPPPQEPALGRAQARPGWGREEFASHAFNLSWAESRADGQIETIAANPALWGDVVLARKDVATSYHLSVVVDDALQGVTHVVRGRDLYDSTGVHRLLQALLGLPAPAYHHHRLVLDADGRKLSKSTRATGLRELRAGGKTPADIRAMIGLD
jgi:glutamyl-Q tRNA(Asp) synthetase